MATKSNFTPDEWSRLLSSPMVAGMAITAADPSGVWGLLKEGMAGGWALLEARQNAQANPLVVGDFIGDVNRGGSCNCSTYHLTPHCNGTHTECVGHITREKLAVNRVAPTALQFATLVSIKPEKTATSFSENDLLITRELLQQQLNHHQQGNAVIVRTLPNVNKLKTNYDTHCPAYFNAQALAWLADIG